MTRPDFLQSRRIVIKIGSSLLTKGGEGLDVSAMADWVAQIANLRQRGMDVLLVSSGSVAEGICRLNLTERPRSLHELQAAASVGQMGLVQAYENSFQSHRLHTAQVLLTHDDLSDRQRYLNARSTLLTLLGYGVVPIINENDAVATEEIRFGDNDTLAALLANLVEADLLIILTDQLGLFDSDPSINKDAQLIDVIGVNESALDAMAGGSRSGLGRGGMATKISAAKLAARSGAATMIASGYDEEVILKLVAGERIGTFLKPDIARFAARKQWLAGHLQVKGCLSLDDGAVRVLRESGKSLLAVGITAVDGVFKRGDLISCVDFAGHEVARGLVNYAANDVQLIKGCSSDEFERLLGYSDDVEVIHRDNLVLL
ncbi:MAG TPA: glutamate 5-kinase [Methylococcaceae bacterium]|nr:glutamate 5-kinase [Methylococcaceae bacterium]HIN69325.1 glutamate 5-kinase [Methylococcales bacterium]HIO45191.1 glutamate 5-kinase [Methylococcales bacterium]